MTRCPRAGGRSFKLRAPFDRGSGFSWLGQCRFARRGRTVMIRDNLPSEPSGCQPATPQLPGSRQSRIPGLRLRLQDPSGSFARLRSTKTLQQRLGAGARHSSAAKAGRWMPVGPRGFVVWDAPPAKEPPLKTGVEAELLASDQC